MMSPSVVLGLMDGANALRDAKGVPLLKEDFRTVADLLDAIASELKVVDADPFLPDNGYGPAAMKYLRGFLTHPGEVSKYVEDAYRETFVFLEENSGVKNRSKKKVSQIVLSNDKASAGLDIEVDVPDFATPPEAPINVSAVVQGSSVLLTWTSDVGKYNIYKDGAYTDTVTAENQWIDVDVTDGVSYSYHVNAVDETKTNPYQFSVDSATASVSYSDPDTYIAPSFTSLTQEGNSIAAQWDWGSDPSLYADIHASSSPQPTDDATTGNDLGDSVGIGNVTSYTFTNLPNGTYTVYVRLRYSATKWHDANGPVQDGRYIDQSISISVSGSTSGLEGMTQLVFPVPKNEGQFVKNDWDAMVSPLTKTYFESIATDIITTSVIDGVNTLSLRMDASRSPSTRFVAGGDFPAAQVYRLSQEVWFDPNISWGGVGSDGKRYEGIKIGFGIGGGSVPSGGEVQYDGFLVRWMTREDGKLYFYVYDARTSKWGTDIFLGFTSPKARWIRMDQEVTMNSVGVPDGILRGWVDGNLVHESTDREYFRVGSPSATRLAEGTFYGGSNSGTQNWSPENPGVIRLRNVFHGPGAFA